MLLDPFKEEFHLPAALVELTDCECRERPIVRQEDEYPIGVRIVELDASELIGIALLGIEPRQDADLITAQSRGLVDGLGILSPKLEVRFRANNERSMGLVQCMQPTKIQIGPIHQVQRARFRQQGIQQVHIMDAGRGNPGAGGDRTAQVQERVEFHGAFGRAKLGPREY